MNGIQTSVDCVIFSFQENTLKVLLIERLNTPFKGMLALPGDYVQAEEAIDASARRTLKAITNLENIYLEQIRAFGRTNRFPGQRVITIGYYALINIEKYELKAGYTTEHISWHAVDDLPPLAFDHAEIVAAAHSILKRKVRHEPIGFNLLPQKFSLTELQLLYEAILQTTLNKRNFRAKVEQMHLLVDTGEKQTQVSHKPAKLYSFDQAVYQRLQQDGLYFKL